MSPSKRLEIIERDLQDLRDAILEGGMTKSLARKASEIHGRTEGLALCLRNEVDLCLSIRPKKEATPEEVASLEGT